MAKNKVAPERTQFKKSKDNFFNRPKQNFKAKDKFYKNKSNFGETDRTKTSENEAGSSFFKSNAGGSENFFLEPTDVKKSEQTQRRSNRNRNLGTESISEPQKEKKPFDKKTWRLQKYSKKYKLQQWEDNRKKAVLRGYYRTLKDDEPKLDVKKIYDENEDNDDDEDKTNEENENNLNASVNWQEESISESPKEEAPKNSKEKKNKAFKKAHLEFQRIKEEKMKKKEEALKKKAEKEEAIQAYKQKKTEKFKKLSRKTKRGQPIMKERMEMLLEKIQSSL